MEQNKHAKTWEIMNGYFGKDNLLSLATSEGGAPSVRMVNAYFEDGFFYVITYATSSKMQAIGVNSAVAICSQDWLSGHGIGESLGYIYHEANRHIAEKLKLIFAAWYNNGHNNYEDKNTIILRIQVTDCAFYHDGERCVVDFS